MYMIKHFHFRKPLSQCSPGHRVVRNRLLAVARRNISDRQNTTVNESLENHQNKFNEQEIIQEVQFNDENVSVPGFFPQNDTDDSNNYFSIQYEPSIQSESSFDCNSHDAPQNPEDTVETLESRLISAYHQTHMNHQQLRAVLHVLRDHVCFTKLHVDPRTVLSTPSYSFQTLSIAGGEYIHLGFEKSLILLLKSSPADYIPDILEIDFSTDEACIDKGRKSKIWPIQIRIANIPRCKPEVVGIFLGSSKPTSPLDFLAYFVCDVLEVIDREGVDFQGRRIPIRLRCFIADAPARAFILGHLGHNSKVPCSRCWVVGEFIRRGVIIFRGVNHRPRTNQEYILKVDGEHHKEGDCPIGLLPMDFVHQTVFDYMHLVCLGVIEKIFQALVDGKYSASAKLSKSHVQMLSKRLEKVAEFCPREFARTPTEVDKHGNFKATENRQILLYSGPAVFFGLVNPGVYLHFLLIHAALRILTNSSSQPNSIEYARQWIIIFVSRAEEVYGIEFLSYNIHTLLHLADDVESYGPLDSISAFPYENNMTYFRKCCRKPNQKLQQIAKRRAENSEPVAKRLDNLNRVSGRHYRGPLPMDRPQNFQQYTTLVIDTFTLTVHQRDNTIILKDSSICVVQNILQSLDGQKFLVVIKFNSIEDFFNEVCFSSSIGVYLCYSLSMDLTVVNANQVKSKCFRMPYWQSVPTSVDIPEKYVVVEMSSSHSS